MQLIGVVILALSFTLAPLVAEAQRPSMTARRCSLSWQAAT
jgi:hypothetical protein